MEHTFCQYISFPTVPENMMSQQLCLRLGGHRSSQRTVQLVGCETIITINFETFLKHKLLEFYYSIYYCCVSTHLPSSCPTPSSLPFPRCNFPFLPCPPPNLCIQDLYVQQQRCSGHAATSLDCQRRRVLLRCCSLQLPSTRRRRRADTPNSWW